MGKSMSLLKHDNASDKEQVYVNNNQQQEVSNKEHDQATINNEHDQATINNLSKLRQNNPNVDNQNPPSITINMPPKTNQQGGAAPQNNGSDTQDKLNQQMCCENRLTRLQCAFLITGVILLTAGCITLGIFLGRSWIKNSVTAKATAVYKSNFVTTTGKHVRTDKLIVGQIFIFKNNTQDTFLVTTLKQPTTVGRTLQQSDAAANINDNIPAFVTITQGAVTAKAPNSDDITLLVHADEFNKQLKGLGAGRLLQGSESKKQLFEQIKKDVAEKAEVDPSQVSVVEERYVKLVANQKGELVAEEANTSRNLDEANVSNSTQNKEKNNQVKDIVKLPGVVPGIIGQSFVDARNKLKRHQKKIAEQTKCGFKPTNDLLVSKEVTKKVGNNHIEISRQYKRGLNRRPLKITNTIVIPVEDHAAFNYCFEHQRGKYCAKRFIDRVDNPFKLSNHSQRRPNLYKQHLFYKIQIYDKSDNRDKKDYEKYNNDVVSSDDSNKKNSNTDSKQTRPAQLDEKKQEKPVTDTKNSTTGSKQNV